MKRILAGLMFAMLLDNASAITTPINTSTSTVTVTTGGTPYCTSGAPTVIVGYFIPSGILSNVSPISVTDGVNIYVSTITGNAVSCFIKQ